MNAVLSCIFQNKSVIEEINDLRKKTIRNKTIWFVLLGSFLLGYFTFIPSGLIIAMNIVYLCIPSLFVKYAKLPTLLSSENALINAINNKQHSAMNNRFVLFHFKQQNKFAIYLITNDNAYFFKEDTLILTETDAIAMLAKIVAKVGNIDQLLILKK